MEACSPIIWEGSSAIFSSLAPVSRGSWLRRLGGLDEPDRNSICWMGVRSYRLCDDPSKVGPLEAGRNRSGIPGILYRGSTPLLAVSSATGAADVAAHSGRPKQSAHATAAINAESSISVTAYGRRPPQRTSDSFAKFAAIRRASSLASEEKKRPQTRHLPVRAVRIYFPYC